MQHRVPRPLRYRHARLKNQPKPDDTPVKKGGTPNLSVIEGCLKTLRANASVPIDHIPEGNVADCWEQVTIAMGLMENSRFYDTLADMIRANFEDLSQPVPGTIGGYFAGCLANPANYPVPVGCLPTCLNGATPSSQYIQENNIACAETVIIGSLVNGSYTFTCLNTERTPNAILYISQPTFTGLTQAEKDNLESMFPQLQTLTVISTANNTYRQLIGPTPISQIETRKSNLWAGIPTGANPDVSSPNIGWIILIVIIVLIIIIAIWWYKSANQ